MPSGKYIRKPATAETSTTTTTPTTTKRRSRKSRARSSSSGNRVVSTGGGAGAQMQLGTYHFSTEENRMVSALARDGAGINQAIENAVSLICQAHNLPGRWSLLPDFSGIKPVRTR